MMTNTENKTPLKGLFMMTNVNVTSTIPELPDFDLEFDDLDYGDPLPNIPTWIEHEDGSGEWSDGWNSENIVPELPQDTFEAYIDSVGAEFGINDYPEDWAL